MEEEKPKVTREYVCRRGHKKHLTETNARHKEAVHESTCPDCGEKWVFTYPWPLGQGVPSLFIRMDEVSDPSDTKES